MPQKQDQRIASLSTEFNGFVSVLPTMAPSFAKSSLKRIDRIHSTLSSDLDSMFSTSLANLAEGKPDVKYSELDRTKSIADLTECLRTYDLLGLWRDAEDIIRRQVVRKFVRKVIRSSAYLGITANPASRRSFQARSTLLIRPWFPIHPSTPTTLSLY